MANKALKRLNRKLNVRNKLFKELIGNENHRPTRRAVKQFCNMQTGVK